MYIVNNKGQTLIVFVILLPILLMIMSIIIDFGMLYIEKRNISNNLEDAITYYLNNIDDSNVRSDTINYLNKNIDNIRLNVNEDENYIIFNIKKERKSYSIIKLNTEIDITCKGNKDTKEIIKG